MFKVKRNYGNGFEVEVEDVKMTSVIEKLAVCDELFMDVRCAANIDGENVVSDKVRFQHRKHDDNDYYEQICMDGKLKWYKRRLGQHKGSAIGSLFVNTKPSEDPNTIHGYAGWGKYNGQGQQGGSYAQQPRPQQQYQPAPQQQAPAPQQQYTPAPQASYQVPRSSVSMDDIPF